MKKKITFLIFYLININPTFSQIQTDTSRIEWIDGYLDIHHILTGSGDCTFVIMPDGTNLLIDAGDIGDRSLRKGGYPLKSTEEYPNNSKTAARWIFEYIKQVIPNTFKNEIDYALLTHFHDDHIGGITNNTKTSKNGNYKISGISEIAEYIPIDLIIDRNYPNYDFPTNLKLAYNNEPSIFLNYLKFIDYQQQKNGLLIQQLIPGSTNQIIQKNNQKKFSNFKIRGVKANGTIWTGKNEETKVYISADSIIDKMGKFNENPLSLAIKISYGKFDYFTGGDNTGLNGFGMPKWFDVETPIAKAVGKVDVTTLCHHGCRDAVNENFLNLLQPKIIVQQSWSSNHPGEEVLHRMIYSGIQNIFATNILNETKITLGFWLTNLYKSTFGHLIIRVLPGGYQFYVLVAETIDEKIKIKKAYGPFNSE